MKLHSFHRSPANITTTKTIAVTALVLKVLESKAIKNVKIEQLPSYENHHQANRLLQLLPFVIQSIL